MIKQLLQLTLFSSFFAQRIFMRKYSIVIAQRHLISHLNYMTSQQAQLPTHGAHRKHEPYSTLDDIHL